MKILAIDTSCDETSVAVVENDRVLSNKLSSQIRAHEEWGGVVPSLARRKHEELIDLVIEQALKQAKIKLEDIDVFAVTRGPGLAIALEVGLRKIKDFALKFQKPLVAVNHMEGHIYSALSRNSKGNPEITYQFPLLALLISGGHTELVLMKDHGDYEIVGMTLDDSIGEAYDKVGRMLDMGYPAGPVLERVAREGDENRYELPIPMKHSGDANMSYSGLKTAAMKLINDELKQPVNKYMEKFQSQLQLRKVGNNNLENTLTKTDVQNIVLDEKQIVADIAASFQKAAVDQVLFKTSLILKKLKEEYQIQDLIVAGGVSQNLYLRKKFRSAFSKELRIHYPTDKKLYTDNAGMIGVAAYFNAVRENFVENVEALDREPNWSLHQMK